MKLFSRYNRINLLAIVSIFLLAGMANYFVVHYILVHQVDDDLLIEQNEITSFVQRHNRLPETVPVHDQETFYTPATNGDQPPSFHTVRVRDHNHPEDYRQLSFSLAAGGQWYTVLVRKSLEGTDDLLQSIVTVTALTILLILLTSTVINRLVLKKLWRPFYSSLEAMRRFEIDKDPLPHFPFTETDEFRYMNESLQQSAQKASRDYRLLREFTEDASHELQTPIAIVRAKLDLLIQDEQLSESQGSIAQAAYSAIQRLSRINQGLLLLTKIENGQFTEVQQLNLRQILLEKKQQFDELLTGRQIQLIISVPPDTTLLINPFLADSIFNNLMSNAIRYNTAGGLIQIQGTPNRVRFSNSGDNRALDEHKLFRRFASQETGKQGIGLGLAIVRQAAESAGLRVSYVFSEGLHHFLLEKP